MIDPINITNFNRSTAELEEFWLFCLSVAGKQAATMALKIDEFLEGTSAGETPFDYIRRLVELGSLNARLQQVRMGKYALLTEAFAASAEAGRLDLRAATVHDLEVIPGVGPKTARYFLLHSRDNVQVAVIDTHITKYLKHRGHDVPKGVPSGKVYARLERLMIAETKASGMSPAAFDLAIWNHYSSGGKFPLPEVSQVR